MKKFLIVILTLGFITSSFATAVSFRLNTQELVTWAYHKKITKYDTVQAFNFYGTITREQATKMIMGLFTAGIDWNYSHTTPLDCQKFRDQKEMDKSLAYYISFICEHGLMMGNKEEYFMPTLFLTDSDLKIILERARKFYPYLSTEGVDSYIADKDMPLSRGRLLRILYGIIKNEEQRLAKIQLPELPKTNDPADPLRKTLAQTILDTNYTKWIQSLSGSYIIHHQIDCSELCSQESLASKTYEISNGQLSGAMYYSSGGVYTGSSEYFTVEKMFAVVQHALDTLGSDAVINVIYDDVLGYPKSIYIKYSRDLTNSGDPIKYSFVVELK